MYDTFISYRRVGGGHIAARVYDYLRLKGFNPFYDITGMGAGRFDEQLLRYLSGSLNYLLILSKGALDRCKNEDDWVRKEILCALENNLNIVVLIEEGFSYPEDLSEELLSIRMFQAIEFSEQTLSGRLELLVGMLQRAKSDEDFPIYGAKTKKHFKISDEYMSYYEDIEDGRVVIRRAPVVLKNFFGRITGKTWFSTSQAWNIRAKMYGKKRLIGTYFAKSDIDDGIGNFFLNVIDANTLEGFWSGYDNVNNTITTGKYVFKRKYRNYAVRKAVASDFASVIKIADKRLGEGYLTKSRLEKILDKTLSDDMLVAVESATGKIIAFSLFKHISYDEAKKLGGDKEFRPLMFSDEIGYIATVATKEGYEGLGVASTLIEKSMAQMTQKGVQVFFSTAWKHQGIVNIGSVLSSLGFKKELEIPKFWYESSLREGYMCPQCGNPCVCSCVIFIKA